MLSSAVRKRRIRRSIRPYSTSFASATRTYTSRVDLLHPRSSRTVVAVGLTLASAVGLGTLGGVPTAHPATAALPTVTARSSDALAESFGIKVITSGGDNAAASASTWDNHSRTVSLLRELGTRHIRTPIFYGNRGQIAYMKELQANGITAMVTMGRPDNSGGTVGQLVSTVADNYPGAVFAFEGTNEWDLKGGSNWAGEVRAQQKSIWSTVRSNPKVSSKKIYGPSISQLDNYKVLGDISPWIDEGNIHSYPGGRPPTNRLDLKIQDSKAFRGNKPVMSSETGYHNDLKTTTTHLPASEAVAGIYYPRMLLEYFNRGVSHMFGYQLYDYRPDGAGLPEREQHFGLVHNDGSRKPAFTAMANLMSLINDPGPGFAPGKLTYGVSGASDIKQTLVQKRDGTFTLLLWRDVEIWDPKARTNESVPTANVTVNLAKSSTIKVIRPSTSRTPSSTVTGSQVTVPMGGEVVALQIR